MSVREKTVQIGFEIFRCQGIVRQLCPGGNFGYILRCVYTGEGQGVSDLRQLDNPNKGGGGSEMGTFLRNSSMNGL